MAGDLARTVLPPDSHPQSRVIPRAQMLLDGFQPMVPARAARRAEAAARPSGRSASSTTTSKLADRNPVKSDHRATASPLEFM